MKRVLHQLKPTELRVLLFTGIFTLHFNCLQAQDIKVDIKTVQNQDLKGEVKTNAVAQDKLISINLFNQTAANQNLQTISITITPQTPIADGTPYVKGADQMGNREGQMMQFATGKKANYNNSNMYLMFKRGDQEYLLVGLVSWRTFLCNIIPLGGRIIIEGDGDNKQIQAGKRVPFDKVVYMQDASWQDLLDRYADMIAKENQLAPAKKNRGRDGQRGIFMCKNLCRKM